MKRPGEGGQIKSSREKDAVTCPHLRGGGEGKNSEKGMRRKNGRSREGMSRKVARVFSEDMVEASSSTVCGYIKKHIHPHLLEKHTEAFMCDVWGCL